MALSRSRVLVAEDSTTQRAYVGDLLRAEGHEVHEAADGRAALDLTRILHPDLLVLDLGLPRLDGRQVLSRLRADARVGETPVLVLTADDRETTVSAALDAGATDFVVKPPHPTELLARVRRALREKADRDTLQERNRILSEAARIDGLTGLPNRRASAEALAAATDAAKHSGRSIAVALLDIDHFKHVNDTYGHPAGDAVLRTLAGRLDSRIRLIDVVGRWGGEEFIAILPGAGPELAASTAEALRAASAEQPIDLGERAIDVTVSVGWASGAEVSAELLVRLADVALYEAKAGGRNRVRAAR